MCFIMMAMNVLCNLQLCTNPSSPTILGPEGVRYSGILSCLPMCFIMMAMFSILGVRNTKRFVIVGSLIVRSYCNAFCSSPLVRPSIQDNRLVLPTLYPSVRAPPCLWGKLPFSESTTSPLGQRVGLQC